MNPVRRSISGRKSPARSSIFTPSSGSRIKSCKAPPHSSKAPGAPRGGASGGKPANSTTKAHSADVPDIRLIQAGLFAFLLEFKDRARSSAGKALWESLKAVHDAAAHYIAAPAGTLGLAPFSLDPKLGSGTSGGLSVHKTGPDALPSTNDDTSPLVDALTALVAEHKSKTTSDLASCIVAALEWMLEAVALHRSNPAGTWAVQASHNGPEQRRTVGTSPDAYTMSFFVWKRSSEPSPPIDPLAVLSSDILHLVQRYDKMAKEKPGPLRDLVNTLTYAQIAARDHLQEPGAGHLAALFNKVRDRFVDASFTDQHKGVIYSTLDLFNRVSVAEHHVGQLLSLLEGDRDQYGERNGSESGDDDQDTKSFASRTMAALWCIRRSLGDLSSLVTGERFDAPAAVHVEALSRLRSRYIVAPGVTQMHEEKALALALRAYNSNGDKLRGDEDDAS